MHLGNRGSISPEQIKHISTIKVLFYLVNRPAAKISIVTSLSDACVVREKEREVSTELLELYAFSRVVIFHLN